MDSLHPMAPDKEELLRFALDGEELSAEAGRHLEQCATCQQRLARYKRTHAFLVSRLYRSQCPDSTKLSLYCFDLLPPNEWLSIANHIQDCPLCTTEAADARHFLLQPDRDLLPAPGFPLAALHATVRRIFAMPITQQTHLVMRSDTSEGAWPRKYRAESIHLSLHLSRASSGEYLLICSITDLAESVEAFTGSLAGLYPAAGGKERNRVEIPLLREQADDLGNIVFRRVPAGEYVMIVLLPGRELIVEGVNIQPG